MVRPVVRILDSLPEGEKAIVVAHSRGGIVASTVAELRPHKVQRLVYLAAYLLRDGERVAEHFFGDEDSLLRRHVAVDRLRLTDMIDDRVYEEALYADCSPEDQALCRTLLTPEPSLPALTRLKLTPERYGQTPRSYIELTQDRAVSIGLQRKLLERSPCEPVFSLEASHSAYFSQPDALSQILDGLARR
jgi:pimeloyl-ACP methyl ester carboxylesterase